MSFLLWSTHNAGASASYVMNSEAFENNDSQQAFSMGSHYITWKMYNSHHQFDLIY